jgi:septum formation protein
MTPQRLILASASPRRRELLEEAGYDFEVILPDLAAEDEPMPRETPPELVVRLARQKAGNVAQNVERGLIIGCDTVVECGGNILGKPRDRRHARDMLRQLRGQVHHVYSGLCLWRRPDDRVQTKVDTTKLKMETVLDAELESYLNSGLWEGKAGAFGYQDRHGWLQIVAGSESNVVGLPLELLQRMLKEFVDSTT